MKIRILIASTSRAVNYGAALQIYALKEILGQHGDVSVLDYLNPKLTASMKLIRFSYSTRGILSMAKDILRVFPRRRAIQKFISFNLEYLNFTRPLSKQELDSGALPTFDLYVAGSDQIWNPECVGVDGKLDAAYFLNFAGANCMKISYASSWGGYEISRSDSIQLKKYLSDFSGISVRESGMKDQLSQIVDMPVRHSLDPTLLLTKEEWSALVATTNGSALPQKYILVYSLQKRPELKYAVRFMSAQLGLPIVVLDQNPFVGFPNDFHIQDAGPLDFLRLFRDAQFVITDSFHGTCFSINFEVPFVSVTSVYHSTRIESILSSLELTSQLVFSTHELSANQTNVSFENARTRLSALRARDLDYLKLCADRCAEVVAHGRY